jgi:hypothetical protein
MNPGKQKTPLPGVFWKIISALVRQQPVWLELFQVAYLRL